MRNCMKKSFLANYKSIVRYNVFLPIMLSILYSNCKTTCLFVSSVTQQLQQWAAAWSSSPIGKMSPRSGSDNDEDDQAFWDNFMTLIMLGKWQFVCSSVTHLSILSLPNLHILLGYNSKNILISWLYHNDNPSSFCGNFRLWNNNLVFLRNIQASSSLFVLTGQIEDACTLLRCHKSGGREDFLLMTKVLESVPVIGQGVHLFFLNQWTEWQVGL